MADNKESKHSRGLSEEEQKVVDKLLQNFHSNPDSQSFLKNLKTATKKHNIDAFDLMIILGANSDVEGMHKLSAITKLKYDHADTDGQNLLHFAMTKNVIDEILNSAEGEKAINMRDKKGLTPVMSQLESSGVSEGAIMAGLTEPGSLAAYMLANGATITDKDIQAAKDYVKNYDYSEFDAYARQEDREKEIARIKQFPALLEQQRDLSQVFSAIDEKGSDRNDKILTALKQCKDKGVDLNASAYVNPDDNKPNKNDDFTLMTYAASRGDVATMKLLNEQGVDYASGGKSQLTPLRAAVNYQQVDALKLLLNDPNVKNTVNLHREGHLTLRAAMLDNPEISDALRAAGGKIIPEDISLYEKDPGKDLKYLELMRSEFKKQEAETGTSPSASKSARPTFDLASANTLIASYGQPVQQASYTAKGLPVDIAQGQAVQKT